MSDMAEDPKVQKLIDDYRKYEAALEQIQVASAGLEWDSPYLAANTREWAKTVSQLKRVATMLKKHGVFGKQLEMMLE